MNARNPDRRRTARPRISRRVVLASLPIAALPAAGCLGLASNLMHAAGMDMVPARYEGLEKSKTAVVVRTPRSRRGQDPAADELASRLATVLTTRVDDAVVVPASKIENWYDLNGFENDDYDQLAADLTADRVLVVEMPRLELRDGQTLYRGRADCQLSVIDAEAGGMAYTATIDDYTFPRVAGQHTSETTLRRFRGLYLTMLAAEIGRHFHKYDAVETVALDSRIAGM